MKKSFYSKRKQRFIDRYSLTSVIIALNVFLFFLFFLFLKTRPLLIDSVAIRSDLFFQGKNLWTIITSMFMHANFFHLFVNMFTLFFLGTLTERIIGRKRFFWLYFISGIVGALFFVSFAHLGQFIPRGDYLFGAVTDSAVGASGAIFGLLGILAVLIPKKEIYLIAGPIVVIVLQFIIAPFVSSGIAQYVDLIVTFLIFFMIFSIFSANPNFRKLSVPIRLKFWVAPVIAIVPLMIIGLFVKFPIGNTAHFGGLVAGLVYGFYLKKKYPKKIRMLRRIVR
jgi:membrane associated rhomboid family serine protease